MRINKLKGHNFTISLHNIIYYNDNLREKKETINVYNLKSRIFEYIGCVD